MRLGLWLVPLLAFTLTACGGDGYSSRSNSSNASGGNAFAAAYNMPKTKPDAVPDRRIALAQPQSGERLDIVYFHNGAYDRDALAQINRLFRDRHANAVGTIDPELIDYMVDIRTRLGLPPAVVFEILSGYRTRATNEKLAWTNGNVAKESLHMRGWAVDFRIAGVNGSAICEIAKTMQRGGVSYYPSDNHVHVDLGNIRTWRRG